MVIGKVKIIYRFYKLVFGRAAVLDGLTERLETRCFYITLFNAFYIKSYIR
jgi:hypothetical protein